MEKEFIPFELALKLKELGFDEECLAYYDRWVNSNEEVKQQFRVGNVKGIFQDITPTPLWQQAFDWFTEKGFHSYIEGAYPWFRYYINTDDNRYEGFKHLKIQEARQACLEKLIELCQQN